MTENLDQLLERMTMEEKIGLLTGADFFASQAVPRLGIPAFQMSDGPHGVRAQEAVKELKGFAKISLEPGETKTVTFTLNRRDFAFYDTQLGDWAVESGLFRICLGASSADIRLVGEVSVEAAPWRLLTRVTQETTYGELVWDKRTYPLICRYLSQSPMYRPDQMPDAGDFLLNMPLWTLNHMAGRPVTPQQLEEWIGELNRALEN